MAQPDEYSRQYNFTNYQTLSPSVPLPGNKVDAEYNAVKVTLDQIRSRLALIQRDDGALKNGSVGADQLAAALEIGFNPPTNWATGTVYIENDNVLYGGKLYKCLVSHTSGTFATDLADEYWVFQFDFGADATAAGVSAAAADAYADAAAASAASVAGILADVEAAAPVTAIDCGRADSVYTSTDPFDGGDST